MRASGKCRFAKRAGTGTRKIRLARCHVVNLSVALDMSRGTGAISSDLSLGNHQGERLRGWTRYEDD